MKTGKSKGAPGSMAKRSYIQQMVRAVWADPERRREDEQFERNRAQSRSVNSSVNIPIVVLADETVEALLAQQQAAHQSSTRPVTMTTAPKPATLATGTPNSEAVDASAPAPWEWFRKPSPTGPRPSTTMVPMPAAIQLPPARKRDRPAPPDPNDMIVVKDDDEPLSGSDKPKGSTKKARTYTEAEKTAIKEKCDSLHSDCRQLQYEKEFESFKVYRKTIKKLWEAPNTDDHTTYIRDYVLKEQAQSYSYAGNLMTARAFLKKIRAKCNDAEKIEKTDKMLREKGMPGVPDEWSHKYTIQGRYSTVPEQLTVRHRTVNIGSREQPGVAQS